MEDFRIVSFAPSAIAFNAWGLLMPEGERTQAILVHRPVVGFLTEDEIDALGYAHNRRVRIAVLSWNELDVTAVEDFFGSNSERIRFVGIRPAGVQIDDDDVRIVLGDNIDWIGVPVGDPA